MLVPLSNGFVISAFIIAMAAVIVPALGMAVTLAAVAALLFSAGSLLHSMFHAE